MDITTFRTVMTDVKRAGELLREGQQLLLNGKPMFLEGEAADLRDETINLAVQAMRSADKLRDSLWQRLKAHEEAVSKIGA